MKLFRIYSDKDNGSLIKNLPPRILDKLDELEPDNYKFIVNTTVSVVHDGAGVHVGATCSLCKATDGNVTYTYSKNKTMRVIAQVFWLAM